MDISEETHDDESAQSQKSMAWATLLTVPLPPPPDDGDEEL